MFIDNETELATTVALDLEAVRPGPGKPIKMWAKLDVDGDLVITMGDTDTAADPCITVACVGLTEFELPSTTLQYIKSTFTGRVAATLCGVQTNK